MTPSLLAVPTSAAAPSLAQLHDLHLPPPVGWWPPAPGWWLLGLLALLLIGATSRWLWRRRHANRYRRAALAELQAIERRWQQHRQPQRYLTELSQLLRRAALSAYPEQPLAGLTDAVWREFLAQSGRLEAFHGPLGDALIQGPYRPPGDQPLDATPLRQLVAAWIRRHRRSWPC